MFHSTKRNNGKIKGLILQSLLAIILLLSLGIRLGEINLFILLFYQPFHYLFSPFYALFIMAIIIFIVLIYNKNDNCIKLKVLTISQVIMILITSLITYIFISNEEYNLGVSFILLMCISLLQVINVVFKHFKKQKLTSIITTSFFLVGLGVYSIVFWTVSRFVFKLNDDGQSYSIVRINCDIPTIKIPSTHQGLPVTKINSNYYIYDNIQKIIFEEDSNIEVIEHDAFGRGISSKIIILPSSLHTIGEDAFSSCSSLEQVFIPISVINIERRAFMSENLIIYCEAEAKLDTWDDNWCYKAKEIIWGYGG